MRKSFQGTGACIQLTESVPGIAQMTAETGLQVCRFMHTFNKFIGCYTIFQSQASSCAPCCWQFLTVRFSSRKVTQKQTM